jgi:hypothetical protein
VSRYWYYCESENDGDEEEHETVTYYNTPEDMGNCPDVVERKIPAQYARPGIELSGGYEGPPVAVLDIQLSNWKATEAAIIAGGYDDLLTEIMEHERRERVQVASRDRYRSLTGEEPPVERPGPP